MSERGEVLLSEIGDALIAPGWGAPEDATERETARIARAICEHLGIDWEDVRTLHEMARYFDTGADNYEITGQVALWAQAKSEALATLLEAAGIPRDGETT